MVLKSNNKLLALCSILLVIFCSGHAFQTIFPQIINFLIPFAGMMLLFVFIQQHKAPIKQTQLAVILFIIMVLCTMVVYLFSGWYFYMIVICNIIVAYGISQIFSFRTVVDTYLKVMTVVTCVSLVGYFLVQNTTVLNALPVMNNSNGMEYAVGGIFNYLTIDVKRNCGMFWEPGLFATHLTIALVFEIIYRSKTNVLRLILFTAGVFTANSSAGFVLWFLCFLLLFVRKGNASKNVLAGIIGMVVLVTGIVVIINFDHILEQTGLVNNEYFVKLSSDSVADSSRSKALEHNLKAFFSAPIFGVGVTQATANMNHVADTSTSTYLLSVFGLMGGAYTICWIYGISKNVHVNIFAKVLLLAIVLIILNKEPHHQILFTWCMLFYLLEGELDRNMSEGDIATKRKVVFTWGNNMNEY